MEHISRSFECQVPSGIQYSSTKHFINLSRDYENPEDRDKILAEYEKFGLQWQIDQFNTYNDFQKSRGAEGHRITLLNGERYPHVTDVLSIDFPAPQIPNLDEYSRIGTANDTLWKGFARTGVWTPEDYKDSGLIKTTYADVVEHSKILAEDEAPYLKFTDVDVECRNDDHKYIGTADAVGVYLSAKAIYDFKVTREIKGKTLLRNLIQLGLYWLCHQEYEVIVLVSPFCGIIIEGNPRKYADLGLVIRGKYRERYGI